MNLEVKYIDKKRSVTGEREERKHGDQMLRGGGRLAWGIREGADFNSPRFNALFLRASFLYILTSRDEAGYGASLNLPQVR